MVRHSMKVNIFRLALISALVGSFLLPSATVALAQDPPPASANLTEAQKEEAARQASKLADELKSPFCPGKTLLTCTSGKAFEVRAEIKRLFLAGNNKEEIIQLLQQRYGDEIRNPPQPWLTGLVPILPFILGGLLLLLLIVMWRRRGGLGGGEDEALPDLPDDPETQARLERLRKQVNDPDTDP